MSEQIWCSVRVKVPTTWNGPIRKAPDGDALVPGAPPIIEELAETLGGGDVYEAGDGWTVWQVDGEGNYGLNDDDMADALGWLRDHGVPHWAQQDPKYDMGGTVTMFDGTTSHDREAGGSGDVVMSVYTYRALVEKHATRYPVNPDAPEEGTDVTIDADALVAAIAEFFTLPELAACSIAHLPAEYPERDDA